MKKINAFFLAFALVFSLSGCTNMNVEVQDSSIEDKVYLEEFFELGSLDKEVEYSDFISDVNSLSQEDLSSITDVMQALVTSTGFEELALTYSEEKIASRLDFYGLKNSGNFAANFSVCALDSHLIDLASFASLVKSSTISSSIADILLMNVAQANGDARNYLGRISDVDIMNKIATTFNSLYMYSDNNLDTVGKDLVSNKASTGYNLKKEGYNANFLEDNTIKYGHCEEEHLKQLVALLNSEGIDAKLQIEPKISIYQYLLDWGPIPESSAMYYVEQYSDDLYLVHAVEFDALFEFDSEEDLLDFNRVIEQYSKKNSENQADGSDVKLISGAWWQPLYSTVGTNHDSDSYIAIYDCVATEDGYSIHPFTLEEDRNVLEGEMKKLTSADVTLEKMFVNNAFYRYLSGESWE